MNLDTYRTIAANRLSFTREQSSFFAKEMAGDFNPLHDVTAKRFCVPGDLLFVCLVERFGLSRKTHIEFNSMVDESAMFELPESFVDQFILSSSQDTECLTLSHKGEVAAYNDRIAAMVTRYVKFSGLTFPDVLVPLMQQHDVMIHPSRPLVIYRSMTIELNEAGISFVGPSNSQDDIEVTVDAIELKLIDSSLDVSGKKAEARLQFEFSANNIAIGSGCKQMLLGGLRPYEQATIDDIVLRYNSWRDNYHAQ